MTKGSRILDRYILEEQLEKQGWTHLQVRVHGPHLIVCSQEDGERWNRARLTKVSAQYYTLSMANHRGKWESTPYRGTIGEISDLLTKQFAFALAPWPS